jgi:hypothetical protein
MPEVKRFADQPFVLSYITTIEPTSPPVLNIFLDAARTLMHTGPHAATVVRPVEFTFSIPATGAGRYYLQFVTKANGQTYYDENDELVLAVGDGSPGDTTPPVRRLRRLTGEHGPEFYSDAEMQEMLTAYTAQGETDYDRAALAIWAEKMARYASMVDMAESGAERKLSQLYKNAQGMYALYSKKVQDKDDELAAKVADIRVAGRSTTIWGGVPVLDRVLHEGLGPRLYGAA